ncbi:MAG: hypothetical protein D6720_10130 [Gammaproteobacteria bacterium]|nr:MAG: hypothetical protein D6720_10130 [Gammaproteobacteria bacterium]
MVPDNGSVRTHLLIQIVEVLLHDRFGHPVSHQQGDGRSGHHRSRAVAYAKLRPLDQAKRSAIDIGHDRLDHRDATGRQLQGPGPLDKQPGRCRIDPGRMDTAVGSLQSAHRHALAGTQFAAHRSRYIHRNTPHADPVSEGIDRFDRSGDSVFDTHGLCHQAPLCRHRTNIDHLTDGQPVRSNDPPIHSYRGTRSIMDFQAIHANAGKTADHAPNEQRLRSSRTAEATPVDMACPTETFRRDITEATARTSEPIDPVAGSPQTTRSTSWRDCREIAFFGTSGAPKAPSVAPQAGTAQAIRLSFGSTQTGTAQAVIDGTQARQGTGIGGKDARGQ